MRAIPRLFERSGGAIGFDPEIGLVTEGVGVSVGGGRVAVTGGFTSGGFVGVRRGGHRVVVPGSVAYQVDRFWWYDDDDIYANPMIGGTWVVSDALAPGVLPEAMRTAPDPLAGAAIMDLARQAARDGRLDEAVSLWEAHLAQYPSDAGAMRELATVLYMDRRDDDAVAMVWMAYRTMPDLGGFPFDPSGVGLDAGRMRSITQRQVGRAHRIGSAAEFLAAAMLMQARDRPGPALRMLERGVGAGLDSSISEPMRAELERTGS